MEAKGYNVLVVANGGLHESARADVAAKTWRLLERPNFGYDFGGLRDAIHFLEREGISPEHLILMNDSIWFPMWTGSNVIEQLETSMADLTGLLFHVPGRNESAKKRNRWFYLRKRPEHIESYVTMVPGQTFTNAAFKEFWKSYKQTNSKILTIKRGEVGLSKVMMQAGLTVEALTQRRSFLKQINLSSNDVLAKTLRYAAYSDAAFEDEGKALLVGPFDANWRAAALAHIERVVQVRRFNASFCWATEHFFQTSFLKKNTDRLFQLGRIQFLEAIENGDIPCDNVEALAELKTRVTTDRSLIGPSAKP
jgi:hypothetical protein